MATLTTVRILDSVRIQAPGALEGTLRMELFNAARQFLTNSNVWREYLPIYMEADVFDYDLVTASKGAVTALVALGKPNTGSPNTLVQGTGDFTFSDFSQPSGDFAASGINGYEPMAYSRAIAEMSPRQGGLIRSGTLDAVLRVSGPPKVTELWLAEVALTLTDPTDGDGIPYMPSWIAEKYFDVLIDGILSRVMAHPAKPYTNEKGAVYHGRRFLSGTGTARTDARHGGAYGAQRWSFPQSFRNRSQKTSGAWGW